MKKRWVAKAVPDENIFNALKQEIETTDILLKLIAQRNLQNLQEAHTYFQPDIKQLHAPFLMKDMQKAVSRLQKAFAENEKIVIYGDYDVDGTTSVALVYSFIKSFYRQVLYYIPDRFKEGYGISFAGIDWAKENGATLIVALDCGIKSVEHIAYATDKGIDFIICDHHTPGGTIPAAAAVLNPKQHDCEYPYKELSGCGIGFKLIQALGEAQNIKFSYEEYLDLVAVSIASDIVHMTGENRILAYFGLKRINSKPRPGLQALIELSGHKKDLAINDLVFRIGPRINAAGRVSSATLAVEMLVEKDIAQAHKIAAAINKNNTDRQGVDQVITRQAMEMIENQSETPKSTVLFDKDWHKGVIGIVASRLIEKHYRPTVLLTESNGMAVGSARSVAGFDLYQAIKNCDDLLEQWGGHQAAAGLTMSLDKVDAFRVKFENTVAETISEEMLTPVIEYDLEIPLSDITFSFCRSIERFGPFGPENMRPVFITRNVQCVHQPRVVGNNHLQLTLVDEDGISHRAIAFGFGEVLGEFVNDPVFDICYTVDINEYRDTKTINLNIKDIHF
ncbi:MAG: single-stranded-DNA-specific exonuclease RecJ [Sphingobacteriales bacterium]|nr:MAG: single-stranded-DNA-specific exonuclease RecJ [Sphingobacteriales bacterium]